MKQIKNIYLGKKGKVFGPFSHSQIGDMRLSGELENFSFQWDAQNEIWKSLEAPPPKPGVPRIKTQKNSDAYDVICHDYSSILAGSIENVTESGCDLISNEFSDSPKIGMKSELIMNVMNLNGQQSVNLKASLSEVIRRDGHWVYRLRWAHAPQFKVG